MSTVLIDRLMATISEFVDGFARKHDQYVQIEKGFEKFCRAKLENLKIQFTWQSRVKGAESLRKKLQDRSQDYEDDIHNINDIKDLVAGRVILTRWKDFQPVEDVIRASFDIKGCIQHPKSDLGRVSLQERFRGYDGLHFHVTRRVSDGEQSSELIIEIQVVSAFMWAFQTLHHDVVYKKLSGDPSKNLLLHIDMLKGIANMGEIAMELYEELLHSDSNSPLPLQSAACSDTLFGIAEFAQKKKEIISNHIRNQKEYEKILRWVSKVNVEGDHHQIREKLGPHYEDSGQWFRSLHNKWVTSSENPIFWLVGSGL